MRINSKAMKWINTGAFVAMIAVNALANLIPLGGKTTGQVSEAYPNLFTPAPVTFAIWGVIYLLLALFTVEQWGFGPFLQSGNETRESVGLWFAVSCLFNIGWIFCWHFGAIGLSVVMIFCLLLSLLMTVIGVTSAGVSGFSRIVAVNGFELYFGWIVAAFLANLCAFLSRYEGGGLFFNDTLRTVTAVILATIAAVMIQLLTGKWVISLAVVWAFVGILIRQISPDYYAGAHPAVIISVIVGIFLILGSILFRILEKSLRPRRESAA